MREAIDHEPTRGGNAETERFKDLYERTLGSYRTFFGEPPEDIWPRTASRFGRDLHYRRVNTATHLVISRSRLLQLGLALLVLLGAIVVAWMN